MSKFNYLNIEEAYENIKHKLIKTPLITNDYINKILNSKVYFKLENLQITGSFKLRGATNKINKLSKKQKLAGVVAYSSGNHAQAVGYASMQENISAKIIDGTTPPAPNIKIFLFFTLYSCLRLVSKPSTSVLCPTVPLAPRFIVFTDCVSFACGVISSK